jgi:serine/threonine-protein kinase
MFDASRRLLELTRAFVDRTPVDWPAILARTRSQASHEIVANLWLLDRLRRSHSASREPSDAVSISRLAIGLLAVVAAMQTASALLVAAVATLGGEPTIRQSPLTLGVAFAGASLILGGAGHDSRRHWLAVMFTCVASTFARASLDGLPSTWTAPVDPLLRGLCPEAFAPVCLWHFSQDFPRGRRFTAFDVIVRRSTSGVWMLALLLFGINLVHEHSGIELGPAAHVIRDHPSHLFWNLFTLTLVPPVLAILVRSRRAPAPERRRISRLAFVIAAGTGPFLAVGCIRSVVPGAEEWLAAASAGERMWVDGTVVSGLLAMPILAAVALIADRPLGSMRLSRRIASPELPSVLMQHVTRRSITAGRVHRALDRLRLARSNREVLRILEDEVRNGVAAHRVHVMQAPTEVDFATGARKPRHLSRDSALLRLLCESSEAVDLSTHGPALALLPGHERRAAIANGLDMAVAVKDRDGTLRAIVACSRGRVAGTWSRNDRWLLTLLATAAGSALGARERMTAGDSVAERVTGVDDLAFECRRCGRVLEKAGRGRCCGTRPSLAALPRHLAGKFVVRRRLGAGGMGVVYLARDGVLDRDVALKTLPALDPRGVERLRAEARAMARLNHESLAILYGLEVWRDTPVLIVEYLERGTLAARLRHGPLPAGEIAVLGSKLAAAIAYMHARHVLHRDVKPGNIGFTASGEPKLLDFGLAAMMSRSHADAMGGTSMREGTAAYLPPEARRGCRPAPAFDLWGLSVVMLEALTGANPFAPLGKRGPIGRLRHRDLGTVLCSLNNPPDGVRAFFERALALEPEHRFENAAEFRRALTTAFPHRHDS